MRPTITEVLTTMITFVISMIIVLLLMTAGDKDCYGDVDHNYIK